jgi:YihY family inner membrane protein
VTSYSEQLPELREKARERVPYAAVALDALERQVRTGGGLLAGGLAYRLFLWLVPLGLVGATIIGFWIDFNEASLEDAAQEFGIGAAAVASADDAVEASERSRVLLLLLGLWLVAWFSLGVVRALRTAFALAWGVERPRMHRPVTAVLVFNGLFLAVALGAIDLAWLRAALGLGGIVGILANLALATTVVLLAMWLLPRRTERWQDLLPGAVVVAVGSQLMNVAVVFYFAPRLGYSSEVYGALGTAAVLLVWLYLLSALMIAGGFLNAVLWDRRQASTVSS